MKYKIFDATGMVAMEKNGKWGLYLFQEDNDELVPASFAKDVQFLDVYEEQNLVVTPEGVFTLFGEKVVEYDGKAEIVTTPMFTLIVTKGGRYGLNIVIWYGEKILFQTSCTDYRHSDKYLALKHGTIWSLYHLNGELIEEAAFDADNVEIHRDFIVTLDFGRQGLYSLKKKCFLKKNQLKILCSDSADLALCAEIGNKMLNVYSYGRWHAIPMEDEFGFVNGLDHMFYIKRGKKLFVYDEDVHRFMRHLYPDGVDFISCENGVLLLVNRNKPEFLQR